MSLWCIERHGKKAEKTVKTEKHQKIVNGKKAGIKAVKPGKDERLLQSNNFRLLSEKKTHFFVYRSGKRIVTDKWGKAIWESLPGTKSEIFEKIESQADLSERLVGEYLYVFLCAGIIRPDIEEGSGKKNKMDSIGKDGDLISVIVVTYNGQDYLKRCFESIKKQTYKNLEVISVDNASKDDTVKLLNKHFPDVRVLSEKKNLHYAGGINRGINEAKGKYVFLLNQDTDIEPDCIEHLYRKAVSDERIGAVSPMMKFSRLPDFINGIGNQISNHGWGTDSFIYCVDIGQFETLKEIPSACFGAVMLSREAIDKVGLVDEGYKSFYEDADWSFRCWLQDWKIVPEAKAVVYHDFGGSYLWDKKLAYVIRNRLRLVLKLFQGRVMLGFLKNYLREDMRNYFSLLRQRQFGTAFCFIKAYFSLGLSFPAILIKRLAFMRVKKKNMRERDVIEKNPSFYCCLHAGLEMPQIDVQVIRRYYRWEILKQERQRKQKEQKKQ